jgi:hypothetical protein
MGWADFANTALQVGASYYSSKQQADAAKSVGKTAAAGSDAATALQRDIYADQRNLNMPFYNGGLQAYDQYRALMGLGGSPSAGAGGTGPQTQGTGQQIGQQSLVAHDAKGVPIANAQLYASDPTYRQAWDSVAQQHQGQWRTGYWNGSDPNWIESNLRGKLPVGWGATPSGGAGQPTQNPQQAQQAAFAAFRNTPGYQFGLDEGNKQIQSSAAARGGLYSGAAMKSLQKFGNDYADQQGYTPYMNRLAGLFGGAQTASSAVGNAGQNYAHQAGANMQNAANYRATGMQNAANAQGQFYNDAAGFLGQYYGKNNGWGG